MEAAESLTVTPSCPSDTGLVPVSLKKLVKVVFPSGGGFIEDSQCSPSTFKILSEWLNFKKEIRSQSAAHPAFTVRAALAPPCVTALELSDSPPDLDGGVIALAV